MKFLSAIFCRLHDLGDLYFGIGDLWVDEPAHRLPPVDPVRFESKATLERSLLRVAARMRRRRPF